MTTNRRGATLVLKTSDLTYNQTTSIGSASQYRTDMTWFNVNMRVLMGDLYDKYDTFNLCLKDITHGLSDATAGTSTDDKCLSIHMTEWSSVVKPELRPSYRDE